MILCDARRSDGAPCTLEQGHQGMPHAYAGVFPVGPVTLRLDEADRQMVLLALARLSLARPGWEIALHTIALQIDWQSQGRAEMFHQFRALAHEDGGNPPAVLRALELFDYGTGKER